MHAYMSCRQTWMEQFVHAWERNLIDIFTSYSHKDDKVEYVLSMFIDCPSSLRVIVATVAFSMGIDAPNVHQSSTGVLSKPLMNTYVQDNGRCGHDGASSTAVLYLVNLTLVAIISLARNEGERTT